MGGSERGRAGFMIAMWTYASTARSAEGDRRPRPSENSALVAAMKHMRIATAVSRAAFVRFPIMRRMGGVHL